MSELTAREALELAWPWVVWAFAEGLLFGAFLTLAAQTVMRMVRRRRAGRGALT